VEQWRVHLGETVARWSGEGFRTEMLERHLESPEPPDVEGIERQFVTAVNRLRALEAEAARLDSRLAGIPVFRDPERVAEAETIVLRALAAYDPPPRPNPHLAIDTFVAGAGNQLALRAAGEVISLPGTRYNPLYVHGPAGSGKTHLAHAIGSALASREGGAWTVACLDSDTFADDISAARKEGNIERWRMRYLAADALILDDAHRLAGRDGALEELFHLFNTFQGSGKQIIVTAGVAPGQLAGIPSKLSGRLASGLVAEIGRITEAERVARHTPVPDGAEAAAPTIDAWFDEAVEPAEPGTGSVLLATATDVDSFFLDPEKVVTDWSGIDGRVVEEPF
jgi:chromosomal replication initiation ATPase DnaA